MSPLKRAATIFAAVVDLIAAVVGYAAALVHPVVQAARREYLEARAA